MQMSSLAKTDRVLLLTSRIASSRDLTAIVDAARRT